MTQAASRPERGSSVLAREALRECDKDVDGAYLSTQCSYERRHGAATSVTNFKMPCLSSPSAANSDNGSPASPHSVLARLIRPSLALGTRHSALNSRPSTLPLDAPEGPELRHHL